MTHGRRGAALHNRQIIAPWQAATSTFTIIPPAHLAGNVSCPGSATTLFGLQRATERAGHLRALASVASALLHPHASPCQVLHATHSAIRTRAAVPQDTAGVPSRARRIQSHRQSDPVVARSDRHRAGEIAATCSAHRPLHVSWLASDHYPCPQTSRWHHKRSALDALPVRHASATSEKVVVQPAVALCRFDLGCTG